MCQAGPNTYSPDDWEAHSAAPKLALDAERAETTVFQFVGRDLFTRELLEAVAKATNITLYTHGTALKLDPHPDGKQMVALRLATIEGQRFSLRAGRFVLALGALENARILLLSNEVHACGVGNQEDQVGRYFMEHPHLWSGRFLPAAHLEPSAFGFYSLHRAGATAILGKLKLSAAAQRQHQLLNYCVSIHPMVGGHRSNVIPEWPIDSWPLLRARRDSAGILDRPHNPVVQSRGRPNPVGGLLRGVRRAGRHLLGPLRDRIKPQPVRFKLNHMAEQAPNPESRVRLGDGRDIFDRPRIELNWSLGPLDVANIIKSQQLLDSELRRSGLGRLQIDTEARRLEAQIHGGWHHMGTTRMHRDPQWGVVDPDCRVHGTTNLYIAGPSVFPTSGYANPVLTIMALAIRLADHLKVAGHWGAP
jgi:choline dehydrogenase-like flavoprotein